MSQQQKRAIRLAAPVGLALILLAVVLTFGAWAADQTPAHLVVNRGPSGDSGGGATFTPISTTSDFVLFERPDGLDSTIWLLEDGITETQIITGHRPRLSPDGRSIVYLAGNASTQGFANWDSIVYYAWAADNSRIFYDFRCKIYAMDPDGANDQEIVGDWIGSGIDYCYNDHPDVNPVDGRLVWENEHYGLGISNADGSSPAWITNTQPGDFYPRWSPDGQWIAFFKIRPDGSDLTQLTFLAGDDADEMEQLGGWSADGQFVVGAGEIGGVQGIYAVAADGSGLATALLAEAGADQYFVGNVGTLDIDFQYIYLPLVLRAYP
jgi:hypothetical protein